MAFSTAEKTPLLPTTVVEVVDEDHRPAKQDHQRLVIEATLQYINLVLSSFQFVTLCVFSNTNPPYNNRYYELLSLLAHGLHTSMPIAAPTSLILFIAIPYITRPAFTRIGRDLVVCCYLVSTFLGGLLVGSSR